MRPLRSNLTALHESGLIRPAAGLERREYLIQHSLVRDTAYRSLLRTERKDIHLVVGRVLRRHFPDEEIATALAQHYEIAEHTELAFKFHLMAADAAYGQYANFEAVDHYERALRHLDPQAVDREELIRIHRYYGRALELIGEFERTLDVLDDLVDMAHTQGDPGMKMIALIGKARIRATGTPVHDHDRAGDLARQALRLAEDLEDAAAEVRALWVIQLSELYKEDDLDEAKRYGLRALEKARQLGEDRPLALVLTDLARIYMMQGFPEKSLELAQEGRELWQRDGNIVMQADVSTLIGAVTLAAGHPERSRAYLHEAVELSVDIDNPWGSAAALANAGMADHVRGRTGSALRLLERARNVSAMAEFPAARLVAVYFTAWVYSDLGAVAQGIELCSEAMDWAEAMGVTHRTLILAIWARLALQKGDLETARGAMGEIDAMQKGTVWRIWTWNPVPLARVEMLIAAEDYPRVVSLCQQYAGELEAKRSRLFVPEVLCHLSTALMETGETEAALGKLQEASALARDANLRRDLWRILIEIAEAERRLGRGGRAERARREARREIQDLVAHIHEPTLAECFLSRPLVAGLMGDGERPSDTPDRG